MNQLTRRLKMIEHDFNKRLLSRKRKFKLLIKLFPFFVTLLLQNSNVKAQEKGRDCSLNLQEVIRILEENNYTKNDSLKAIKTIKPCVKEGSSNAQLLLGRLYLNSNDEDFHKKGFKLIKKAAKQNQAAAMYDLAVLYKYGKGCNLNFEKAEDWYRKSANLGNEKAIYSIGYMYYKGLGTIKQDYEKAVMWFKKSDDPMAKYWLGICYFYGYGVEKNEQKAFSYFKNSKQIEEKERNKIFNNQNIISNQIDNDTIQNDTMVSNEIIIEELTPRKLNGKWKGKLLLLDWSGKNIEQTIPVSLQLTYNKADETVKSIWNIIDKTYTNPSIFNDKTLYFDDLFVTFANISFTNKIAKELEYQILSSGFELKTINNKTYLTGNVDSLIDQWKEPGVPIRLVLARENILTDNNQEISEEVLQALSDQKDSFIKLYPNPFQNDLIIAYTLEKDSFIQISITNLNTSASTIIEQGKNQKSGDHSYFFDGRYLPKGMYIITIIIDGLKKTKLIIKE